MGQNAEETEIVKQIMSTINFALESLKEHLEETKNPPQIGLLYLACTAEDSRNISARFGCSDTLFNLIMCNMEQDKNFANLVTKSVILHMVQSGNVKIKSVNDLDSIGELLTYLIKSIENNNNPSKS